MQIDMQNAKDAKLLSAVAQKDDCQQIKKLTDFISEELMIVILQRKVPILFCYLFIHKLEN